MFKVPLNIRMALAAAIAMSADAMSAVAVATQPANSRGPNRRRSRVLRRGGPGTQYPEQSSRQAMRAYRRAQGGPGIVLVDGVYQPREAA